MPYERLAASTRPTSGDRSLVLRAGLPQLPERLLLAHAQGRVIFIAGAGVSMQSPACLPDFGSLVRRVFARLDIACGAYLDEEGLGAGCKHLPQLDVEQRAMLGRIKAKEYDVALGMLERRMDSDQQKESTVRQAVADILRETVRHSSMHTALIRLADRGVATTIATTNFDLLLEQAGRSLGNRLPRYALGDIPRPSLRPEFSGVLHLHGSLDPNPDRFTDLVLTDRDFGEHYMRRRAIPDFIYDLARVFHVVLVGYSLSDPPMRYLLNAVAADGQRFTDLKERFAFVGMTQNPGAVDSTSQEVEVSTWKGRGITPIPYDASEGHRALSDVLEAWAELSPRGGRFRPRHVVRQIAGLQRNAASEDTANLFGHVFRRCSDVEQLRIAAAARDRRADPGWLDLMADIAREGGAGAHREAHVANLCTVSIKERLTDRKMLGWAAGLGVERTAERGAILDLSRWLLDTKTPEPWRTAWILIASAQPLPKADHNDMHGYRLGQRLQEGDRSGGLIAELVRFVSARMHVEPLGGNTGRYGPPPKRARTPHDLLNLSLTSNTVELGKALNLSMVRETAFLVELAEALESGVVSGLHLGRRLGWHDRRDLVWLGGLDRVSLRACEPDDALERFQTGLAPSVRLLMHTICRLAEVQPTTVAPFLRRWATRSDPVHQRMWAAAAIDPSLSPVDEVAGFLLRLPEEQFWLAGRYPEVAELRATRFADIDAVDKERLADRLLSGPPLAWVRKAIRPSSPDRLRIGLAVRELTRIRASGAALPPKAVRWLLTREADYAEYVRTSVAEDPASEVSARIVAESPDGALDKLQARPLAAEIDARLRADAGAWSEKARGAWNWLEGDGNAWRLATALMASGSGGETFGMAWDAVGHRHRPPVNDDGHQLETPEFLKEAQEIIRHLAGCSDTTLEEAAGGLCQWLGMWSRQLRDSPELLPLLTRMWPFAVAASVVSNDATDYGSEEGAEAKRVTHDAFNSPMGWFVQALLASYPEPGGTAVSAPPEELRRGILKLVGDADGRPGIVARFRCVKHLPFLMSREAEWTEANLLSRMERNADGEHLWHALAYSPNRRIVMARLARSMAREAVHGTLETSVRRSLVERVCSWTLRSMLDGTVDGSLLPDVQQMLRSVPDELRSHAARTIRTFLDSAANSTGSQSRTREDLFDLAVAPFFQKAWPLERSATTPGVSSAIAAIPASSGRRLAAAVALLRRFLIPFQAWTMHDWNLLGEGGSEIRPDAMESAAEASAVLTLLDLTIGADPDVRVPVRLDAALARLEELKPEIRHDPRFGRLFSLTRP